MSADSSETLDAVVIGAGISGLSAGWALRKAGKSYCILEKNTRPGGPIQTIREDGFLFELGPNTVQVDGADLDVFFSELDLDDQIVEANPAANKRYIVRDKEPRAVPMSPLEFFTTKLFSKRAMLGVLAEPFKKKRADEADESLADFVRRRLNQEFLDYAINPLIGGIYAGDPENLSVKHGFPKLDNLEAKFGSLIKGSLGVRKEKKAAGNLYKTRLISFKDGMETLPKRLAEKQADAVKLNIEITEINQDPDGLWHLSLNDGSTVTARKVIVATTTRGMATLPFASDLRQQLELFQEIHHPAVTGLSLGFKRKDIDHALDGFGMLIPKVEKMSILGCLFSSTLFPGRARDSEVGLTVFVGGTRNPEMAALDDAGLKQTVLDNLNTLLGVRGDPIYFRRTDWPQAIPQYEVGFGKFLERFAEIEAATPGLRFIGHSREGIAVPKCIRSGLGCFV